MRARELQCLSKKTCKTLLMDLDQFLARMLALPRTLLRSRRRRARRDR